MLGDPTSPWATALPNACAWGAQRWGSLAGPLWALGTAVSPCTDALFALIFHIPNCYPVSQGEIKLSDQPPSLWHLKTLEDANLQIICILSHQVLVLYCSTTTLSSSPQGPDSIQAAETPATWPWSCPCVTVHLIHAFIFGKCNVSSGKISSCAPANIPENSHWCFSFLPFPWNKALRAILLYLLVLFWYIMQQGVSRCLSSFLLSSCLSPSITLSPSAAC